jgi:hypothetical protein
MKPRLWNWSSRTNPLPSSTRTTRMGFAIASAFRYAHCSSVFPACLNAAASCDYGGVFQCPVALLVPCCMGTAAQRTTEKNKLVPCCRVHVAVASHSRSQIALTLKPWGMHNLRLMDWRIEVSH